GGGGPAAPVDDLGRGVAHSCHLSGARRDLANGARALSPRLLDRNCVVHRRWLTPVARVVVSNNAFIWRRRGADGFDRNDASRKRLRAGRAIRAVGLKRNPGFQTGLTGSSKCTLRESSSHRFNLWNL